MKFAVLYSRLFLPWLEPILGDLEAACLRLRGVVEAIAIEDLLASYRFREDVERLYVFPTLAPAGQRVAELVRQRFPRAHAWVSFEVQELCWNKIATQKRLLERAIATPETLVTADPQEVHRFVRQHRYAILKEPESCAGSGHWVLWLEHGTLMADNGLAAYRLRLLREGTPRIVADGLEYPAPFYVQRLVGEFQRDGFQPGQVLRAYVVDEEIPFWGERYRERYRRPGDWILNVARGARYRFVLSVSEETRNAALRAARAVGARVAAVDLVRTSADGPLVLEVDTDSYHMCIDRSFKNLPEYRDFYDFDFYLARALLAEDEPVAVRAVRER